MKVSTKKLVDTMLLSFAYSINVGALDAYAAASCAPKGIKGEELKGTLPF